MKLTIFENFHAGVSMLEEADQDRFYGSLARYAFEGAEPDLDGIAAAVWATIKPLVDKSLEGQANGAKGGNGRGNKGGKTQSENPTAKPKRKPTGKTQSENPSEKPPGKTGTENQKNRKEGNGKENLEDFFSNSDAPDDAAAARAAPPDAIDCPICDVPMERTNQRKPGTDQHIWRCPLCAEETVA